MFFLTGGSGVLGSELQKQAASCGLKTIAPSHMDADILDELPPYCLMEDNSKIDAIVHCAAYTDVPGAEKVEGKRKAIDLNIIGSRNVKGWAGRYGIPFVYISTDYVYPGEHGDYKESDTARPINFYACTKFLGETWADEDDLIIRTSFKPNTPWPYPKAFDDLYTSADYVDVIADKILFLLRHFSNITGVVNVGTERKSIYDLARKRNKDVKPMSRKEIKDVYLPKDVSLDTSRYDEFYDLVTGD